ncbi:carboxymuconolactone decarboxylase family protein [Actinosynnema sp. NPDC020468]|uniref:carboxymuconolactone decarboxylase family protein n=1 Tax=Actinosynnema sp. NPDC020468 TaxID=3154488 RepID=UPI0033FE3767
MTIRVAADRLAPHMTRAMKGLEKASRESSLEGSVQELVRLRASQVNGCAYCVDLHVTDAREEGEEQRRLDLLVVWREADLYTERERAALGLTEAVTRLADGPVSDEVWAAAAAVFSEVELTELLWVIATINTWNRVAAASRAWPLP